VTLASDRFDTGDERIDYCGDSEVRRVNHRQIQRIRLTTQVRRPTIHLRATEFGLPARSSQSCVAHCRCRIQQHNSHNGDAGSFGSGADERRTGLAIKDADFRPVRSGGELIEPSLGRVSLPLLRTAKVAAHLLDGRHPDRVEVIAADAGQGTRFEGAHCRGFSAAGGSCDDKNSRCGHLLFSVMPNI
jgi:hypothetical protein